MTLSEIIIAVLLILLAIYNYFNARHNLETAKANERFATFLIEGGEQSMMRDLMQDEARRRLGE